MKSRALARILALASLCAVSVPIMGGGNDCPKACIIEGTTCAPTCNGPTNGTCNNSLVCIPPDEDGDPDD